LATLVGFLPVANAYSCFMGKNRGDGWRIRLPFGLNRAKSRTGGSAGFWFGA
jgi:hypothetical protein